MGDDRCAHGRPGGGPAGVGPADRVGPHPWTVERLGARDAPRGGPRGRRSVQHRRLPRGARLLRGGVVQLRRGEHRERVLPRDGAGRRRGVQVDRTRRPRGDALAVQHRAAVPRGGARRLLRRGRPGGAGGAAGGVCGARDDRRPPAAGRCPGPRARGT